MSERITDTMSGFLEILGEETADVIIEDGAEHCPTCKCNGESNYTMPVTEFIRLGIEEGERFWIDVVDVDGVITGRIRPYIEDK